MWLPETKGIDLDEVLQQQEHEGEGDQDVEKNGGNCGTKNNEAEGKMLKLENVPNHEGNNGHFK
jgi:hypothetical protein